MVYPEIGMDQQPEIQQSTQKEDFLAKLPLVDKENIEAVNQLFQQTLKVQRRAGTLLLVGGILTKLLPRPDIDLLMGLESKEGAPKRQDYLNELYYALADFKLFQKFVIEMLSKDEQFRVEHITQPYVQYEPDDPNNLLHEGSVTIKDKAKRGMPIEIIRWPRWKPDEKLSPHQTRPSITLTSIEPVAKEVPGSESTRFNPAEILDQVKFNVLLNRQAVEAVRNKAGLTLAMITPDINTPSDDKTYAGTEEALKSAMQMVAGGNIGVVEPGKYGIILPKLDPDTSIATTAIFLQTASTLLSQKRSPLTPAVGIAFYHPGDKGSATGLYGRAFEALTHAQKEEKRIVVVLKGGQNIALEALREDIRAQITLVRK